MEYSHRINDRYLINSSDRDRLGFGGMSAIHPGIDEVRDLEIAGKTLLPEYQTVMTRRARFQREADTLSRLDSPHIVKWLATVDGRYGLWLIMERLHGATLNDVLEDEGIPGVRQIADWLDQAAAALDYLHGQNLVHLDVKPGNLFLTDDGVLKLIDFGIAQPAYQEVRREAGNIIGTVTYISPEHVQGGIVTPASDVFGLGCVVHELLTGQKPVMRTPSETPVHRTQRTLDAPTQIAPDRQLPKWVDDVVARATALDPADRYTSAGEFAAAFRARAYARPWNRIGRRQPVIKPTITESVPYQAVSREEPLVKQPVQQGTPSFAQRWARRQLRSVRRVLLVFAMLMAIVLAFPLYAPPATDLLLGFLPGVNTRVTSDQLNLRVEPSINSGVVAQLERNQRLRVTGLPERSRIGDDVNLWWPVKVNMNGTSVSGWVADGYIHRTWLMDRAVGVVDVSTTMRDWWDWLEILSPGLIKLIPV